GLIFHQSGDVWRAWPELKGAGWSGFFSLDVWGPAFQTLVHIAVTSLWLLPVIGRSARVRVVFAGVSAGLHLWISSAFWFDLVAVKRVIDGGPPGFLTWSLPAVAGTLVYDALSGGWKMPRLAVWGCLCMMAGYALSCLSNGGGWAAPPFTSNPNPQDMWTMSQRAGSASYQLFAAGFSIALYSVFRVLCDFRGWRLGLFNDLGSNALAAYLLHNLVMDALLKFAPKDSPAWWALSAGVLHFLLVWWMVRWLNAKKLYLRL
ncbi:MAG TPA: hypothetical protein VHM91_20005, partial [Verrucomicrobiales bacterium]|nr:hypothetical protein [Verrucomicrobiales bacterium]